MSASGEGRKRSQISIANSSDYSLKIVEPDIVDLNGSIKTPSGSIEPCLLKKLADNHVGKKYLFVLPDGHCHPSRPWSCAARCLILVYTVCRCPIYGTIGLNELSEMELDNKACLPILRPGKTRTSHSYVPQRLCFTCTVAFWPFYFPKIS